MGTGRKAATRLALTGWLAQLALFHIPGSSAQVVPPSSIIHQEYPPQANLMDSDANLMGAVPQVEGPSPQVMPACIKLAKS